MTITLSGITNGNRTLTLTRTTNAAKLDAALADAAEYWFNAGLGDHGTEQAPRTFASQSTAERLAIIETYWRIVLLNAANQNYDDKAVKTAHISSAAYVAANQDL